MTLVARAGKCGRSRESKRKRGPVGAGLAPPAFAGPEVESRESALASSARRAVRARAPKPFAQRWSISRRVMGAGRKFLQCTEASLRLTTRCARGTEGAEV